MKNLIRALARLPGRRLRLLIRAGRMDAKVQKFETRLASIRRVEARLERRLAAAVQRLSALLHGAGAAGRGPGRPPKRRGPGRPPKRRGPGRPPKVQERRGGRRRVNEKPLAQVLKDILAKKGGAFTVSELAGMARDNGYKTKSKPEIFAITVSLALRKNAQTFQRTGKKYQLTKSAESAG